MASKKATKAKKGTKAKRAKKPKTTTAAKKVRLHVFVKPIGYFNDAGASHPGIVVPEVLLQLAAAASTATINIVKNEPLVSQWAKLKLCLEKLYAGVASPQAPRLMLLTTPSCWNEAKKIWEPAECVAANAVVHAPNYEVPNCPGVCWQIGVGLQVLEH